MNFDPLFLSPACLLAFVSMCGVTNSALAQTAPPQTVLEKCSPSLVFSGHLQTPAYNPFAQGALISDSDIGFRNADCGQSITINAAIGWKDLSPRLTNNRAELAFSLFVAGRDMTASDGGLSTADALTAGAQIILPPESSGTIPNLVRLVIREGQIVPPGLYTIEAPINTKLASGPASAGLPLDSESKFEGGTNVLRVTTEVLAIMKLGISGCDVTAPTSSLSSQQYAGLDLASSCKLKLGDPQIGMINGDIARARLTSLTNINFVIAMTSRNGGMLVPVGHNAEAKETEQIHYRASVQSQGREFDFLCTGSPCGQSHTFEPSPSPLGTDLYFQLRVDDPDLNQKRAGTYSDVITLVIQPAS